MGGSDDRDVIQFPAARQNVDDSEMTVEEFADEIDEIYQRQTLEWESRTPEEIDQTEEALDLARDFLAALERRGMFRNNHWTAPARQAINLCAEYMIWRRGRLEGSQVPEKFIGVLHADL